MSTKIEHSTPPDLAGLSGSGAPAMSRAEAEAHVRTVTEDSGSSFYWAMRFMPAERRRAMYAIYAFCREVDDIADGEDTPDEKRRLLDLWRADIDLLYAGEFRTPTTMALLEPVNSFGLRRKDFLAVIDGMEMDVGDGLVAPSRDELALYCDRVAGAVGLLSIRAFGATEPRAEDFAIHLGTALQLTNILRDLVEDAENGRLYLPRELLTEAGIPIGTPRDVLAHPALPTVCSAIAAEARRRYGDAEEALADCSARPLRPAVVMMMNYRRLLDSLEARGWSRLDEPVGVSKLKKMLIALRYGILN